MLKIEVKLPKYLAFSLLRRMKFDYLWKQYNDDFENFIFSNNPNGDAIKETLVTFIVEVKE